LPPGFVAAVLSGVYDPEADFNDDLLMDEADIARIAPSQIHNPASDCSCSCRE